MESSLWQQLKAKPMALGASVLLHVALIVLLSVSLSHTSKPPMPKSEKVNTVQAVVVDSAVVEKEIRKLQQAETHKKNTEEARKKKLERDMKLAEQKREQEEKRLADIKRKQKEQEKAEKLKQKQRADELAKLEKQKQELEKQRQAEQQRLAAIEEKRKAEEKAAAERKRKQEAEARRKAEEAELQKRLAEEARQMAQADAAMQKERAQYIQQIIRHVERNWLQPLNILPGWQCDVSVVQNALGDVTQVNVLKCTGSDQFRNSVERAVNKASPLPLPSDPRVFEKRIQFTFKPES